LKIDVYLICLAELIEYGIAEAGFYLWGVFIDEKNILRERSKISLIVLISMDWAEI
jgi:hypothetical protein